MQAIAEQAPDRTELINKIILRNFPTIRPLEKGFSNLASHDLPEMLFPEVYAYHTYLGILPMWELEFILAEMEKSEEERFYNQENCQADFLLWSKASYWKVDEGIALALGKDPRLVSLLKVIHYRADSEFVQNYILYSDLADRAKQFGEIFEQVYPTIFMGWAKARDLPFPFILRELLQKNGHAFVDWKDGFEKAITELDKAWTAAQHFQETANTHSLTIENQQSFIAMQAQINQDLRTLLDESVARLEEYEKRPAEKGLDARERESLLKIILACAMDCYGYAPEYARNTAASDIEKALVKIGLRLDCDTIRKYLKESAALFSAEVKALTE